LITTISKIKIKRWQSASRVSAFMPTVRLEKIFRAQTISTVDRGGTNSPDEFIAGRMT